MSGSASGDPLRQRGKAHRVRFRSKASRYCMKTLFAETALLPDGWARDVRLSVKASGDIAACETGATADGAELLRGTVLAGMPNLHSHAFQRAMAGLTERSTGAADSFWTWRETMYGFLAKLTPGDVR